MATRDKILEIALELFSKKGFSGTSIGDIAQHAHVQKSLIYYYFVNKNALWHGVKEFLFQSVSGDESLKDYEDFEEFLRDIIKKRMDFYESDPRIERMLKWQMLEDSQEDLQGRIRGAPLSWNTSIEVLQEKEKVIKTYPANLICLYIHSALSGAVFDTFGFFAQNPKMKKVYLEMLIESFIKSFQI